MLCAAMYTTGAHAHPCTPRQAGRYSHVHANLVAGLMTKVAYAMDLVLRSLRVFCRGRCSMGNEERVKFRTKD
jgi:hypothetical protein